MIFIWCRHMKAPHKEWKVKGCREQKKKVHNSPFPPCKHYPFYNFACCAQPDSEKKVAKIVVSGWTALILIQNLMKNNVNCLVFCYLPIQQKLWDIKMRPSFSLMILLVLGCVVCCVVCGDIRKAINSHMDFELRFPRALSAHTFCR